MRAAGDGGGEEGLGGLLTQRGGRTTFDAWAAADWAAADWAAAAQAERYDRHSGPF